MAKKKSKSFKFKTMSVKIKFSKDGVDSELLKAMGFNVIVDKSISKGEIYWGKPLINKDFDDMFNIAHEKYH